MAKSKAKKKDTVLLLTKEQAATFPECRGMSDKELYEKMVENAMFVVKHAKIS